MENVGQHLNLQLGAHFPHGEVSAGRLLRESSCHALLQVWPLQGYSAEVQRAVGEAPRCCFPQARLQRKEQGLSQALSLSKA